MSSNYKLNELAGQDYFEMELDGFTYRMSYPSGKDILSLEDMGVSLDKDNMRLEAITTELLNEPDTSKRKELLKESEDLKSKLSKNQNSLLDWASGYVKPVDEKAPDFKETLMSKSVKYLLAFINILQEELK